jgi:DNA repair protein RadA/Sms
VPRRSKFSSFRETKPISYGEIESQDDARTSSGIDEFDRVLGGGIVAGSLVLIGGAPGIGKSTLVLQVADKLSQQHESSLRFRRRIRTANQNARRAF